MQNTWLYVVLPALLILVGIAGLEAIAWVFPGLKEGIYSALIVSGLALVISLIDAWLILKSKDFKTSLRLLTLALFFSLGILAGLLFLGFFFSYYLVQSRADSSVESGMGLLFAFIALTLFSFGILRFVWFVPSVLAARFIHRARSPLTPSSQTQT